MKVFIELHNVHPLHARDMLLEAIMEFKNHVLSSTTNAPVPKFGKLTYNGRVIASYEITYSFALPEKLP